MKNILIILLFVIFQNGLFSQKIFTSRKGLKFIPGHLDIVITINNEHLKYELFNHWYSLSYAILRQITIPLDSLNSFNSINDTINISLKDKNVLLIDKKYKLQRKIRHKNLCATPEIMRKISFAYKISSKKTSLRHFDLYTYKDLQLPEDEFKLLILKNLKKTLKNNQ